MKDLFFKDTCDLADALINYVVLSREPARVIGNYYDAANLFKDLLNYDEVSITGAVMEDPCWGNYDREYLLTVNPDLSVSCEKSYQDDTRFPNRYYKLKSDVVTLVHQDVNHKAVDSVDEEYLFAFCLEGEDNRCDGYIGGNRFLLNLGKGKEPRSCARLWDYRDESTQIIRDASGRATGFTKSWSVTQGEVTNYSSYSFISDNVDALCDMMNKWEI